MISSSDRKRWVPWVPSYQATGNAARLAWTRRHKARDVLTNVVGSSLARRNRQPCPRRSRLRKQALGRYVRAGRWLARRKLDSCRCSWPVLLERAFPACAPTRAFRLACMQLLRSEQGGDIVRSSSRLGSYIFSFFMCSQRHCINLALGQQIEGDKSTSWIKKQRKVGANHPLTMNLGWCTMGS